MEDGKVGPILRNEQIFSKIGLEFSSYIYLILTRNVCIFSLGTEKSPLKRCLQLLQSLEACNLISADIVMTKNVWPSTSE